MGTIQDKLNLTLNNKNSIKNAIRSKGIEVTDEEPFSSYAQKIIDYNGIDTSDADATAEDIVEGKTAYVNGEKITGNTSKLSALGIGPLREDIIEGVSLPYTINLRDENYYDNELFGENPWGEDYIEISTKKGLYGNRFTSEDIITKAIISSSEIANAIDLKSDQIVKGETVLGVDGTNAGLDTSDADATAEDIAEGKTAYVNGEKVTGTASSGDFYITDATYLFYENSRIEKINELIGICKNLTKTYGMFIRSGITEIPQFDTSNVKDATYMFNSCSNLTTIPKFNMSNVINISYMCVSVKKLTTIGGFEYLGKAYTQQKENHSNYKLDLSGATLLTHESLMNVINNLYDLNLTYNVANGGTLYTQQLVLGATNLAKLTEEEIGIAQAKGWTVS